MSSISWIEKTALRLGEKSEWLANDLHKGAILRDRSSGVGMDNLLAMDLIEET